MAQTVQDDYIFHERDYRGFVRGVRLAVVALAGLLVLFAVYLV